MLLRIDLERWFTLTPIEGAVNGDGEVLVDVSPRSSLFPLMLRAVGWAIQVCALLRIRLSVDIGSRDPITSGWSSSLLVEVPDASTVDPQ